MAQDKYTALWLSNSSIRDYLTCPRLYYLHNIYKDPKTRKKINIINPHLALGQAVHVVLESLSLIPVTDRKLDTLHAIYEKEWEQIGGRMGGFLDKSQEQEFKKRGRDMIQRVIENPGPILQKALNIKIDSKMPPHFFLSDDENIILNGKIDWIEYIPETDGIHIIDFKTGNNDEKPDSLQLAIYCLLVKYFKKSRNIDKVSYWYIGRDNTPTEVPMPDCSKVQEQILEIARKIKKAKLQNDFPCIRDGCFSCRPFEAIIKGQAEFIRTLGYQDIYVYN